MLRYASDQQWTYEYVGLSSYVKLKIRHRQIKKEKKFWLFSLSIVIILQRRYDISEALVIRVGLVSHLTHPAPLGL